MPALTRFDAENCAVVFLGHTPSLFPVDSIEADKLENGVLGLAKVARELGMPVVISTIRPKEAALADPLFGKLTRVLYADDVIERTTFDAFASEEVRRAIEETGHATGMKRLIMSGLWTETSLLQSVTSARSRRREVAFVEDCSGGVSERSHQAAIHRMAQSGATPVTWWSLIAELCPDTASEQYKKIYSIIQEHAGVELPPHERAPSRPTPPSDWSRAQGGSLLHWRQPGVCSHGRHQVFIGGFTVLRAQGGEKPRAHRRERGQRSKHFQSGRQTPSI